jgi:glycosyltransferase involved in cell wall biosynthesis
MLSPIGVIVVSVPIGEYPQDTYLGNPYEAHVDTWEMHDLRIACDDNAKEHSIRSFISQEGEIGVGFAVRDAVFTALHPSVAAYMICKDEAKFIERCITSITPQDVAEIVICDTGSSDDTKAIIKRLCEQYSLVKLHEIYISPWRFDDARNTALCFVNADIELCISIDGDELLTPGFIQGIKEAWSNSFWQGIVLTRINHSFQTHWNWDKPTEQPNVTRHFHERVHARHGYRWVHPVHEKLIHRTGEVAGWAAKQLMLQLPDTSKDRSSYGAALEQAVREDPADWKLWSFLAGERLTAGNVAGAIEAYDKCAKLPDSDKIFIHQRLAGLYEWNKQSFEAGEELKKAIELAPTMRENYVLLAELLERFELNAANEWRWASSCTIPTQGYLRRDDIWTTDLIDKRLAHYA